MQVLAQLCFFGLTFRCCTGCTMSYALHSNHAMGFRPHLSLRLVVTQAERLLRNQPLRGNDGGLLGYIHKHTQTTFPEDLHSELEGMEGRLPELDQLSVVLVV